MAKKNKEVASGENLVANAPLNNAELASAADTAATAKKSVKNNGKKKSDKPGFFKRIGRVFKEMFSELKKVSWPTFAKTMAQLGTVLLVVVIFLGFIVGFDSLWTYLLQLLIPATQGV